MGSTDDALPLCAPWHIDFPSKLHVESEHSQRFSFPKTGSRFANRSDHSLATSKLFFVRLPCYRLPAEPDEAIASVLAKTAPGIHSMASHRSILTERFKSVGLTHVRIAKAMGWRSPASAGHKLRGRNEWSEGELVKICALAGMTMLELAELSDDLPLSRHQETTKAARILDSLSAEKRRRLLDLMETMAAD